MSSVPDQPPAVPNDPARTATEPPPHASATNRVLETMLDRLFAALVNGPGLNCRPHNSRQRVDWTGLGRLKDLGPDEALRRLLGEGAEVKLTARVPAPKRRGGGGGGVRRNGKAAIDADGATDPAAPAQPVSPADPATEAERGAERAWLEQSGVLTKLRVIADDAKTYEQDTGVHVLNLGFPLLSLPPGTFGGGRMSGATRRVLAPIAFVPVTVAIRHGAAPVVHIECRGDEVDRVVPNMALLAWIERETGKPAESLFADERGTDPWRELADLVRHVCEAMEIATPAAFERRVEAESGGDAGEAAGEVSPGGDDLRDPSGRDGETGEHGDGDEQPAAEPHGSQAVGAAAARPARLAPPEIELRPAPRADEGEEKPAVLCSAVLGLFPVANQGLLRDMQALAAGEPLVGPVESFVRHGVSFEPPPPPPSPAAPAPTEAEPALSVAPAAEVSAAAGVPPEAAAAPRDFAGERLVTAADPCQARAVRLAREARGLVVHGPPGTGKSQTISNIIGDHLARGQRVLFVCDKRTALDVVANRLEHMGLGRLCAVVHDPQRDQRDLYRGVREQLDELPEAATDAKAEGKLAKVDEELAELRGELAGYNDALSRRDPDHGLSFHEMVGEWLALADVGAGLFPAAEAEAETRAKAAGALDEAALAAIPLTELNRDDERLRDALRRGEAAGYADNPWVDAAGVALATFLARPMDAWRGVLRDAVVVARETDATDDPSIPPFECKGEGCKGSLPLVEQGKARAELAKHVRAILDIPDRDAVARWAPRPAADVLAARQKLADAAAAIQTFRGGPLDPALFEKVRARLPSGEAVAAQAGVLQAYLDATATWSARFNQVRAASPQSEPGTIVRWLAADPKTVARARQALAEARPLAEAVAAGPLDRAMLGQYRRQPFDVAQLVRWQGLTAECLDAMSKWYAFLLFKPKREFAPVAQFFGLAVNPADGAAVKQFLAGLRARLELRQAMTEAGLAGALPDDATDADLLAVVNDHRGALEAMHATPAGTVPRSSASGAPSSSAADVSPEFLRPLMPAQADAAAALLAGYGLPLTPASTAGLRQFLAGLQSRLDLHVLHHRVLVATPEPLPAWVEDADLERSLDTHGRLLELLERARANPAWAFLERRAVAALRNPALGPTLVDGLKKSPARAAAIVRVLEQLRSTGLFDPKWIERFDATLRQASTPSPGTPGEGRGEGLPRDSATASTQQPAGRSAAVVATLSERLDGLEHVLRIREALAALSPALASATRALLALSASDDDGVGVLRRAALANEIRARLQADPTLQGIDGHRVDSAFGRIEKLEDRRRALVRDMIVHRWTERQRGRLLAATGSRLNAAGADLRRRMTSRGERAMRLRQVISVGRHLEGGDPLLDLRPVWMASPETVAQIFPREAVFDVVVFDEASQCRLEEALPVLLRGRRVTIAGDPQQLPPTRFFESAAAGNADDEEIETDQQLFEVQQADVEDLLAAALGLDIQQCYLDVHYRSRNADLIEFSNEHFYGSRLQAIPGNPANRPHVAPVTLYRADGTYVDRVNEAEADAVCRIVRDLLKRGEPPSIGIACFNLQQRDLIVERLDELADEEPAFAKRLEKARERLGAGSFEGLFVKNLENVQGDERDHIIISTTYGPDAKGRFYRRFGPVGRQGGGRRLNVLVTRARQEVHLVTSIPREAYRALPAIPPGQTPTGAWLLFAYLQYAEKLAEAYDVAHGRAPATPEEAEAAAAAGAEGAADALAAPPADAPPAVKPGPAVVVVQPTRTPSPFARAIADALKSKHGVGSDVHWGNEGFTVDVALHDPDRPGQVTAGVLCDGNRFTGAGDAVEWDVFRTGILRAQGWRLRRIWSPHFFRDPQGCTRSILKELRAAASGE
jgi:hypothetical protein